MSVNVIATASASANGFAFERRIGYILNEFKEALSHQHHTDDWVIVIHDEQEIRDFFKEQSLNGVDHMVQIQDPAGQQHLFLLQQKWKLQTNQREVSQFLDCCARIAARMPDYKGLTHKMWVSRTVPSLNGEKSLQEGQCIVVQTCTSQTLLAVNTLFMICEILGCRDIALSVIGKLGSLLPSAEEAIADPKEEAPQTTFEPVSNFGEKRVLPITKQTVVMVKKVD
jgi:hypothetical protein